MYQRLELAALMIHGCGGRGGAQCRPKPARPVGKGDKDHFTRRSCGPVASPSSCKLLITLQNLAVPQSIRALSIKAASKTCLCTRRFSQPLHLDSGQVLGDSDALYAHVRQAIVPVLEYTTTTPKETDDINGSIITSHGSTNVRIRVQGKESKKEEQREAGFNNCPEIAIGHAWWTCL